MNDIKQMREGVEDLKREVANADELKSRIATVPTECARAALSYVEYLESVGAHTSNKVSEVAANKAAADLTSLIARLELVPNAVTSHGEFARELRLLASAAPATLTTYEANALRAACDWIGQKGAWSIVKSIDGIISKLEASASGAAPAEEANDEPVATVSRNADDSLTFAPLCDFYVTNGMPLFTRAAPAAQPDAWEWAPSVKLGDDEVIFYSSIYQTESGLPVMTDSHQNSPWNVATIFKRRAEGIDWRHPVRILTAEPAPTTSQPADDADFKNFHRLLCERFGYTHDERDWKRDQLSLIEHIATTTSQPDEARDAALEDTLEPVVYLRWWARQFDEGHGNIGHEEGFEVCEPHDTSDDGAPAFPVYASARAAALAPTAASPSHPDPEQTASIKLAAELLEHYAKYCYEVKPEDIERHPYIPSIEQAAEELRAMVAGPSHPVQQQEQGEDRIIYARQYSEFGPFLECDPDDEQAIKFVAQKGK